MQSVVAGLSENNQKLSIRISDIENMLKDDVNVQIADIKKNQEEQNEKIDKLTEAVTALGEALSAKGVKSKPEKSGVDKKAKTEKTEKAEKNKTEKKSEEKTEASVDILKLAPADLLAKANKDFQAKKYDAAKGAFSTLVEKNHKPAYSNYMLGEIAYATGNYGEAIGYYKKSVAVYSEGDYMPRLLYHAGISCDKTNQKEQANKFYSALKQTYPDSKEAKAAPERK